MVTLKRRRESGKMEILFNTNGSWHTSSNVRTPTLHCETKNLNTEWFIHKHREKRENKVRKWRRQDSQKVETLCNFDDSKQTTYQTGHMKESENHFGISPQPKDLLQLYTSFTFSQNWPWITANVTLDCENDALYSVSTPRVKSIIAYFSFLISPYFLNSVVPFASNANLYQQWMPRLHVHQFV